MSTWFLPALGIKILCGWLVGVLYLYYYDGGDTWNYFKDGVTLGRLFQESGKDYALSWVDASYLPSSLTYLNQPRAMLMSHLVSLGCIVTQNNYWFIATYFSMLGFAGLWYLGQTICRLFTASRLAVGIALFAYPSFVFWSAGILKETIAMGLISVIVAWSLQFYYQREPHRYQLWKYPGWIGAAYLLWVIKYYYAAVLLPIVIALILAKRIRRANGYLIPKALCIFVLLVLTATLLHPNLGLYRIMEVVVKNQEAFLRISDPANVIHFNNLEATWQSMLLNAPLAWFSSWFRPLAGETNTILQHIAGLENWVVLGISIVALVKLARFKKIPSDHLVWILGGFIYALLLGILLAFSSPNFGTLIRYKVAYAPFLVYFCLIPLLRKLRTRRNIDRDIG